MDNLIKEYNEYRKTDKHPLPWIIWLKFKKKAKVIKNDRRNANK